jgi:hypothetical protein
VRVSTIRSRIGCACWAALFVAIAANGAAAQTLTISGPVSAPLRITTATAGSAPTPRSDNTTTYTVKAKNAQPRKITAAINSAMPAGTTLQLGLTAVTGSVGVAPVTLSTTAQTVLTNITTTVNRTGAITYTFTATSAAGVITSSTRIVTFTLVAYP